MKTIQSTDRVARRLGFSGTPAFALEDADGELTAIEMPASVDDVREAVAEAN